MDGTNTVLQNSDTFIVESSIKELNLIKGVSIPQFVWNNLFKWPNAHCLECYTSGRIFTFQDVQNLSRSFATGLAKSANIRRGDTISLILPNSPAFVIALFGAWELGCTVSPVNPLNTQSDIAHQLKNADVKCVITTEPYISMLESTRESLQDLHTLIVVNDEGNTENFLSHPKSGAILEFWDLTKTEIDSDLFHRRDVNSDDIALLLYSSGTTGLPKGVMLSHANFCSNIIQISHSKFCSSHTFVNGNIQEVFIGLLPFFHSYALVILVCGMVQGSKMICMQKFQQETFVDAVRKHRVQGLEQENLQKRYPFKPFGRQMPTILHLVTPLIDLIVNTPEFTRKELENCRTIVFSAAPASKSLLAKVQEKAGKPIFLQQGYGMTEFIFSHLVEPKFANEKPGSIGRLLPGNKAKVVDMESGTSLDCYQYGELWIKGPSVMKGYFKNAKATENTVDTDGFLHTGDLVYYDEDGWFYIVDRIKDIMKVRGFQVTPSELENHLRKHPDIIDVAVIGVPLNYDEVPRAYIVSRRSSLKESDVKHFIFPKVAPYKQLKGGVQFVSEIPRSAAGKILRRQLLKEYMSKLEQ